MRILRFIDKALARFEGWILIFFLGLMVTLTFFQVFLRALFIHGHLQWANTFMGQVDWTEPLVRLLVLWVTFLGASLLTNENRHIKIDLMSDLLPSRWQPMRELILSLASALAVALMLRASIVYLKTEMTFGGALFLGVPTWVGQLILPAGFSILLFRFSLRGLGQLIEILKRGSKA